MVARKIGRHRAPTRIRNRILLVEDHAALAAIRQAFLEQQGYEVICVTDGEQALQLLESQPFHLVVTDSALPIGSGWEVARVAKARGLPVILSSGWRVRISAEQVAACGVDYLCPKPCSLNQLLLLIEKALVLRRPVAALPKTGTNGLVRKPRRKCDS